jgi:hypothetical protein
MLKCKETDKILYLTVAGEMDGTKKNAIFSCIKNCTDSTVVFMVVHKHKNEVFLEYCTCLFTCCNTVTIKGIVIQSLC